MRLGFIGKIEWLDNFLAKAVLKIPVYSDSYSADYIVGEAKHREEEEKKRREREEEEARLVTERERRKEEKQRLSEGLADTLARYEAERNKPWWQKLWPF